jgi:hypothetical protein
VKRVILAVLALTSIVIAADKPSPLFPDVTERGRLLYQYDQACWHASDAVEPLNVPTELLGRYIAQKTATGWHVAFGHLNEKQDRFLIAVEAEQGASLKEFKPKRFDTPVEDTGFYFAAAKAIATALNQFQGESRPYNAAVLPAKNDQLYVYIYPAQTRDDVIPLGGDIRYLIAPDGTIVERHPMHKTILEVPYNGSDVLGFHTHILSDVPEDTDVFHVLRRDPPKPECIINGHRKVFLVSINGDISLAMEKLK